MPFTAADISRQLRLGEDSAWEFKQIEFNGDRPVGPRRDDLADEIGAFANAAGGVLLCGVTNAGDALGMTRGQMDNLERILVEISQDTIKPRINISTFRQEIDDKAVLLAEIPEGYAAHESPGGVWQRVGSSKRLLNTDEQMRLAQRRGQARFVWYDEQPVPNTGFASLDESLWRPLLSSTGAAVPEIALTRMGLLTIDSHNVTRATVAGLLICSRAPEQWMSNAYITATHYRGNDRSSGQVDSQDIFGPIQDQVRSALTFVMRNMRLAASKHPGRENLPQYSEQALFEAVVNAVVHRDYSIRASRIRIAMFADRIEINSPGGLPNNLTIESIGDRQVTRNQVLTSILSRIPVLDLAGIGERQYMMERRGDGITIIRRETYELAGKLPDFDLINDAEFRVTIPSAALRPLPTVEAIRVRSNEHPVVGADVIILPSPSGGFTMSSSTDENGEIRLISSIFEAYTGASWIILIAAYGYRGRSYRAMTDLSETLVIDIEPLPGGGSLVIDGSSVVPGLHGRLNPVLDSHNRICLYTTNIAIDDGQQQPVYCLLGEALTLTDVVGNRALVRVIEIVDNLSLVEYQHLPSA